MSSVVLSLLVAAVAGSGFSLETTAPILDTILQHGIDTQAYPGTVGVVGNASGVLYMNSIGRYSYAPDDTPMDVSTMFDMASCTKVVSTTSAVALLYQEGYLGLNTLVGDILGEAYNNGGKEDVRIVNCLVHNAGYAPDPDPNYYATAFACPQTSQPAPAEDFSCWNPLIYDSFMSEILVTPPGAKYVYSDLSFITLQLVVGTVVLNNSLVTEDDMSACMSIAARRAHLRTVPVAITSTAADSQRLVCAFEAFVRTEVFQRPLSSVVDTASTAPWMPSSGYNPPEDVWANAAPTTNDTGPTSYTHKRLQGQVSDGNAYAMGGIAGHAGLFTNILDMSRFARYLLAQSVADSTEQASSATRLGRGAGLTDSVMPFLNATTVQLFAKVHNATQSSRALGWATNLRTVSIAPCAPFHRMHVYIPRSGRYWMYLTGSMCLFSPRTGGSTTPAA
jgi:CubicO group peptidase (beta-lactamase class C family)